MHSYVLFVNEAYSGNGQFEVGIEPEAFATMTAKENGLTLDDVKEVGEDFYEFHFTM